MSHPALPRIGLIEGLLVQLLVLAGPFADRAADVLACVFGVERVTRAFARLVQETALALADARAATSRNAKTALRRRRLRAVVRGFRRLFGRVRRVGAQTVWALHRALAGVVAVLAPQPSGTTTESLPP